jgi:hypothetical protein
MPLMLKHGHILKHGLIVATLLLEEWEDDSHIPEMGTWEFARTSKTSKFDHKDQDTSHWGVLYNIGNLSKCKCQKWARMSHSDTYNTSYDKKKGRESNWQFDSRPLKIRNQPDLGACRWSATHLWTTLDKSYKFAWDLIPIRGSNKKL